MQTGPALAEGGEGQDYIYMYGAGSDTLRGGADVDVLQGWSGYDRFEGGGGTDYLFLGSGNDLVVFQGGDGVHVVHGLHEGGTRDGILFQGTRFTTVAQILESVTEYSGFS